MQNNISVSLEERHIRQGGAGLSWNVTAPCRVEAEVWLCKREQPGGHCEEVHGSRQKVHDGWIPTRKGHWVKESLLTSRILAVFLIVIYSDRFVLLFMRGNQAD